MSQPVSFSSTTDNFALPLLFAGQAQKEVFVNQSFAMLDALMQQAITASQSTPPPDPSDGECFRVTAPSEGDWTGHDDEVAMWIGGGWTFCEPIEGMLLFDRAEGRFILFRSGWRSASTPTTPQGGTVIDSEARDAIGEITEALRTIGFLSEP